MLLFSLFMISGCQMSENDTTFDPEKAALARLKLGLGYLAQADKSEANIKLAHYNLSLANQYSPNNPNVMLGMALFDQRVGEYNEAEMIYQNITKREPNNGLFLNHYGAFLCATDHYEDAKAQFNKSIQLNIIKWKIAGLEQLGYCAIQNRDPVEADQAFKQLFQYDSSAPDRVSEMANIYRENGDIQTAKYLSTVAKQ